MANPAAVDAAHRVHVNQHTIHLDCRPCAESLSQAEFNTVAYFSSLYPVTRRLEWVSRELVRQYAQAQGAVV